MVEKISLDLWALFKGAGANGIFSVASASAIMVMFVSTRSRSPALRLIGALPKAPLVPFVCLVLLLKGAIIPLPPMLRLDNPVVVLDGAAETAVPLLGMMELPVALLLPKHCGAPAFLVERRRSIMGRSRSIPTSAFTFFKKVKPMGKEGIRSAERSSWTSEALTVGAMGFILALWKPTRALFDRSERSTLNDASLGTFSQLDRRWKKNVNG
jgi:hypothetical protein